MIELETFTGSAVVCGKRCRFEYAAEQLSFVGLTAAEVFAVLTAVEGAAGADAAPIAGVVVAPQGPPVARAVAVAPDSPQSAPAAPHVAAVESAPPEGKGPQGADTGRQSAATGAAQEPAPATAEPGPATAEPGPAALGGPSARAGNGAAGPSSAAGADADPAPDAAPAKVRTVPASEVNPDDLRAEAHVDAADDDDAALPEEGAVDPIVYELREAKKLRDVLSILQDRCGYKTIAELTEACHRYKDDVPLIGRVGRLNDRVNRTAKSLGVSE